MVLSIAVGVFAVGMIAASQQVLSQGLAENYLATTPASAMLMVSDPFIGGGTVGFGDELVEVVRDMREVAEAEGRRKATVRMQVGPDEWRDMQLFALPDYEDIRINKVLPQAGQWPPEDHELLIERAALPLTEAQIGDTVIIKTATGKRKEMPIVGTSHDLSQIPAPMDGRIYGYVTFDTLEWLGEPRNYNELYITVANNPNDKQHIQMVADLVKDKVERSGRPVYYIQMPLEPNKHVLDYLIQAIVLLLGILGILALLLSGFLVITTISAILAQHVRQIGILKAVGMRRRQIIALYGVLVTSFGLLALLIAIPLSAVGAQAFSRFMAAMFNFDLTTFALPRGVLLLQGAISLLVPILAALVPILRGTHITVREALASDGAGGGAYGNNIIDRVLHTTSAASRARCYSHCATPCAAKDDWP